MDYKRIPLKAFPSKPDNRDYPITRLVPKLPSFPEEYRIIYPHEVKNQGEIGSCVAHSLAYAREIIEEKQSAQYTKLSPGFVYANRGEGDFQGEGMYPREALKHLKNEGICTFRLFPDNQEYSVVKSILEENREQLFQDAFPRRIVAYTRLYSVEEIQSALMQLGPVTVCLRVCPKFYEISPSTPVLKPYETTDELLGYHEVTIIGWRKEKQFIVLNSWGSEWGDQGIFYIPFSSFKNDLLLVEAWSMTDTILPHTEPDSKAFYRVLVGGYVFKFQALRLQKEIELKGFTGVVVRNEFLYQVQVGAFAVEENAKQQREDLNKAGYNAIIIKS
jgi:hypothetical protein